RGVMNEVGGRLLGIFANNLAATLAADAAASSAPGGNASSPAGESAAAAGHASAANGAAPGATTPAASSTAAAATAIDELKLPARATTSLHKNGITTIGELASKNADELLAIDGIGPASVEDIKAKLSEFGLTLGQTPAAASTA